MRTSITAQQSSFFTKNGYIEFGGIDLDVEALFQALKAGERDQWQHSPLVRNLLIKKLGPIALVLAGKKMLRLGADLKVSPEEKPQKMGACTEFFSVQGLQIGCIIAKETAQQAPSPIGLLPLPSQPGNVLFFRANLLLDWPHCPPADLYLATFALPNAVYVENRKDPKTNDLKKQGYAFGDLLRNDTHPLF